MLCQDYNLELSAELLVAESTCTLYEDRYQISSPKYTQ